jgi:C-terminal processing protease CtpA/Prc
MTSTDVKRLDDHFLIGVPIERPINPVTKTDWEGKGIQPDVKVPAADAFEKAKQLAADALAKKHPAAK